MLNLHFNRNAGSASGDTRSSVKSGAAEKTDALCSGPEKFHVQLTNVSPKITEDRIKDYILEQNAEVEPVEIKETTTEGWETKRFLITFDMASFDTIMDDKFWPKGIYYKQWFVRNFRKQQPGVM
jgi:phage anti-repressor protein